MPYPLHSLQRATQGIKLMEKLESDRSGIEEVRREIARQQREIETFFADLALRLVVDRPKSSSYTVSSERRQIWINLAARVKRLLRDAPDLMRRLKTTGGAEMRTRAKSGATGRKPKVTPFLDDEADLRKELADIGYFAIGPVFLYSSRISRDKVDQLIDRKSPGWELTLGRTLAAGAELHLLSSSLERLGEHAARSELRAQADQRKAEIRVLQDDELGREARGRRISDWTTTMQENGVVYQALFGMVSNRAGTALKALLQSAGLEDVSVDGRIPKEEFSSTDWAELRKDLGLDDIAPYRTLLASPEGDRLLDMVSPTNQKDSTEQVRCVVETVLGAHAGLNVELCVTVFRTIYERLSRFNRQWFRLRRHEQFLNDAGAEPRTDKRPPGLSDESDTDELGGEVPDLLTPAGREIPSPGGAPKREAHSAGACEGETEEPQAYESSDSKIDNEASNEDLLHQASSGGLQDDCDHGCHVDERRFASAFLSATCSTQLLVYMKRANLAKIPVGNGDEWAERPVVYAATIDAVHSLCEARKDPATAAADLCTRLAALATERVTNQGFAVFGLEQERGHFLYRTVLELVVMWRNSRRNPAAELQAFELNFEGRSLALTGRDRKDLERMFARAVQECEASPELRTCLAHYLAGHVQKEGHRNG